jgi:uncharacterized membrane protein
MQFQASIEIRAPARCVFEVISTPERLPQWNEAVVDAHRVSPGAVGPGSRAQMQGKVLGQLIASETEVVGFEPNQLFATNAVRGPRLNTTFRLAPLEPAGTRLDVELRGELPGGSLANLVAEPMLRAQLTRSLEQLRILCERDALSNQAAPKESESC